MEWVIAAIVVVVLGLAALAATGALGEMRPEAVRDVYRQPLPDRPLTAADLDAVRFGVAVRGYAMGQVDDLLDRLRGDLARLELEAAQLRSRVSGVPAGIAAGAPDPFAEYALDGGQGIPEEGPWYAGDGGAATATEEAGDDAFPQYPGGGAPAATGHEE